MTPNVEWSKGHKLAEYAEAVGVPVDHVMAVGPVGGPDTPDNPIMVLFTPEGYDHDNPQILRWLLRRDTDGILRRLGLPEEVPGMWAEIRANLDQHLG